MSEPYYQDDLVTLYHGDCREVTAWLEADVLITDPPYGVGGSLSLKGRHKNYRPTPSETHAWDADVAARDMAVSLWGNRPYAVFGSPRRPEYALPCRQAPLIWDKGELTGMGDTTFPWRPNYEVIFVNGPGWVGKRESSVIRFQLLNTAAKTEGHPTPKPVGLMQTLIAKAPAGTVADPFSGSGSTLVAAKQLGRRAVGVELDERYCEITAKRLGQDTLTFEEPA